MPSTVNPEDAKIQACPLLFQEAVLVQFLFEDEASIRPLDKVTDPDLLDEIAPVRSLVEKALTGLSCEELEVIFWKAEDGALKMTLRGPDDVVSVAKSLIGDRTAIPPTQH